MKQLSAENLQRNLKQFIEVLLKNFQRIFQIQNIKEITLVIDKSKKIKIIDIDNEDLVKKLIEYKVPKREIAKIISSITQEKVNKIYDSIKNL